MTSFQHVRDSLHSGMGDITFELRSSLPRTPLSPRPVSSRKTSSNGSNAASSNSHHSSVHSIMNSSRLLPASGVSRSRSDVTLRGDSQSGHVTATSDSIDSHSNNNSSEKACRSGMSLSNRAHSRAPSQVSLSVPASPVSGTNSAFETLGTSGSRSVTGGYFSSTDGDLETASEGPASIWSRRPSLSGHHRKSSSLGSRVDFVAATFASLADKNAAGPRPRSLSPAFSEAREELRDASSEPSPPTPKGEFRPFSHSSADMASTQDSVPTRSVSPIKAHSGPQDTPKSVLLPIPDDESPLTPATQATFDTAEETWSANFWVVISDPKVSRYDCVLPSSTRCTDCL